MRVEAAVLACTIVHALLIVTEAGGLTDCSFYKNCVANSGCTKMENSGCDADGTIPNDAFVGLERLTYLDISGSGMNLEGTIPSELANLTNVEYMSMISNRLTGTLPPELSRLFPNGMACGTIDNHNKGRCQLKVSRNLLTGTIPSEFSSLSNAYDIAIYQNELTGCVPESIYDLIVAREGAGSNTGTQQCPGGLAQETWCQDSSGSSDPLPACSSNVCGAEACNLGNCTACCVAYIPETGDVCDACAEANACSPVAY